MIRFFQTYVDKHVAAHIADVLDSTMLSEGAKVAEFENELRHRLATDNVVAVNSGTSALHLALVCAGVGPGDEVIIPPQTFVATGLAVLMCGATPVFCDVDPDTGNMSAGDYAAMLSAHTRAVIPVHWGGHPCDLDSIRSISSEFDVTVIEDAAHAFGAAYKGYPIGSHSDMVAFSFQAIKHLTTGDGGCVCTASSQLAQAMRDRRWFGINREGSQVGLLGERETDISSLGFKYHMNNVSASIGLANLQSFDERLARHREIAERYNSEIADHVGLRKITRPSYSESSWWFYGIHVERRNDFARAMADRGVPVSVVHRRIDRFSIFEQYRRPLPGAESFDSTQINLPVHSELRDSDVDLILAALAEGW